VAVDQEDGVESEGLVGHRLVHVLPRAPQLIHLPSNEEHMGYARRKPKERGGGASAFRRRAALEREATHCPWPALRRTAP
jgi:hypothetical protein